MLLTFAVVVLFFKDKLEVSNRKVLLMSAIWFFGIYIVAHIYSEVKTPILKFPVMLFALPFLFLLISVWFSRFKHQGILFSVFMLVMAGSTTKEKELFGNMHYELFEEIAVDIVRWNDDYGEENIYTVYNINNPNYMNFYANQWDKEIHFDWDVIEFGDAVRIREHLLERKEDYCIVGYSARLTLPQVFETCKEFYPNILEYKKYNNSAVFLLARTQPGQLTQNKATLSICTAMTNSDWQISSSQNRKDVIQRVMSTHSFQLDTSYHRYTGFYLDSLNEYGPILEFPLKQISDPYEKYIRVNVQGAMEENGKITAFVSASRGGEQLMVRDEPYWQGANLEQMINSSGEGYFVFKIPDFLREDDAIKIGIYSRNLEVKVCITSIRIEVYDNIWN